VTTLTAKAFSFSISFSQHACGIPLRYATKAPPEPEILFESMTGAGTFNLAPGLGSLEPTAKILPGDGFLAGTPRIFGCQGTGSYEGSLREG
jgi:hypothetical protein